MQENNNKSESEDLSLFDIIHFVYKSRKLFLWVFALMFILLISLAFVKKSRYRAVNTAGIAGRNISADALFVGYAEGINELSPLHGVSVAYHGSGFQLKTPYVWWTKKEFLQISDDDSENIQRLSDFFIFKRILVLMSMSDDFTNKYILEGDQSSLVSRIEHLIREAHSLPEGMNARVVRVTNNMLWNGSIKELVLTEKMNLAVIASRINLIENKMKAAPVLLEFYAELYKHPDFKIEGVPEGTLKAIKESLARTPESELIAEDVAAAYGDVYVKKLFPIMYGETRVVSALSSLTKSFVISFLVALLSSLFFVVLVEFFKRSKIKYFDYIGSQAK